MTRHDHPDGEPCWICESAAADAESARAGVPDGTDYEYAVLEDREYGRRYER